MTFGIIIVTILLIVSGAIAYIGDNLGRKIGKKKVSVMGLRPKHTSIMVTIITGALITGLTLCVILALSTTARTALFGLKKLRHEYGLTKELLKQKTTQHDTLKKQLADVNREYSAVGDKLHQREAEYNKLLEKFDREQEQFNELMGQINLRTVELSHVRGSLQQTERDIAAKNLEIQTKIREIGGKNEEIVALESERAGLEKERGELLRLKEKLEGEVTDIASRLSEVQKDVLHGEFIYQKNQPLARIIVEPGITRDELERKLRESMRVLIEVANQKGAIQGSDADLFHGIQIQKVWSSFSETGQELVVEVRSSTNVIKGEPFYVELSPYVNRVLFRQGEVVATEDIPALSGEETVRETLSGLLSQVMELARRRGILPDLQTFMVGSMPYSRFMDALTQLTAKTHAARIELFATRDTRVADKLQIDFRIK